MSAMLVLPMVWATEAIAGSCLRVEGTARRRVDPEVAFYRKYTEGLLGRYVRMSMEAGKVPSLLGKEMFRGHVTNYRVDSFEDVVIFVHDIEKCLGRLETEQQRLLSRIALQNYTIPETARMFRLRPSTVLRRYHEAVDNLTRIFLEVEILQVQKACQGGDFAN